LDLEHAGLPQHVAILAVAEGGPMHDQDGRLRLDAVRGELGGRLELVPAASAGAVPRVGQGLPLWVGDPGFELANHVRTLWLITDLSISAAPPARPDRAGTGPRLPQHSLRRLVDASPAAGRLRAMHPGSAAPVQAPGATPTAARRAGRGGFLVRARGRSLEVVADHRV
jgi:hypothetical protein